MRKNWKNLNGEWDFCFDQSRSGDARKLWSKDAVYDKKITVPFCVESALSGIGYKDFIFGVWYKKKVILSETDIAGRTVLHFGAADYKTIVYVNEKKVGEHEGGYVSFAFDVSDFVHPGENLIVVNCEDDTRDRMIPRGKQSEEYFSHGCDYTRTTGIWQTVWLEFKPNAFIADFRLYPQPEDCALNLRLDLVGKTDLSVRAEYEGREVGEYTLKEAEGCIHLHLPLDEKHLWEPGHGRLYDLKLTYGEDTVISYFGLRSVSLSGYKFLLNGRSVFQRLVLDQGFYPDGIYTAPSDEALLKDIHLSKAYGFNGARLHQKVFEERFLYHCDKEGYLVWGEFGNWGLDHSDPESIYHILPEWIDEVKRDFNHPAIIGWCPFNETWDQHGCRQYDPLLSLVYRTTKAMDPTRPCIDTSGNYHVETDIFDLHDYEQDPVVFRETQRLFAEEDTIRNHCANRQEYPKGMPMFYSEYGGIKWSAQTENSKESWGYGNAPTTPEEYKERYKGLTDAILDNPKVMGFCYTQLTDVEQEQNGCYYYSREQKFDPAFFHAVNSRKAAIED